MWCTYNEEERWSHNLPLILHWQFCTKLFLSNLLSIVSNLMSTKLFYSFGCNFTIIKYFMCYSKIMLHFEKIISYLHLELKMWFEQLWNLNLIQYWI